MPSCWRAAAPGLWLVVLSIHFMLLRSLICSPPCAGRCRPPNPAGQESRRRPEDKIQCHGAAAAHKQAPFGVKKKKISCSIVGVFFLVSSPGRDLQHLGIC